MDPNQHHLPSLEGVQKAQDPESVSSFISRQVRDLNLGTISYEDKDGRTQTTNVHFRKFKLDVFSMEEQRAVQNHIDQQHPTIKNNIQLLANSENLQRRMEELERQVQTQRDASGSPSPVEAKGAASVSNKAEILKAMSPAQTMVRGPAGTQQITEPTKTN